MLSTAVLYTMDAGLCTSWEEEVGSGTLRCFVSLWVAFFFLLCYFPGKSFFIVLPGYGVGLEIGPEIWDLVYNSTHVMLQISHCSRRGSSSPEE